MTPKQVHHDRLSQLERAADITPHAMVGGIMFYGGIADKARRRPETYRESPVPESNELEDAPRKQEP